MRLRQSRRDEVLRAVRDSADAGVSQVSRVRPWARAMVEEEADAGNTGIADAPAISRSDRLVLSNVQRAMYFPGSSAHNTQNSATCDWRHLCQTRLGYLANETGCSHQGGTMRVSRGFTTRLKLTLLISGVCVAANSLFSAAEQSPEISDDVDALRSAHSRRCEEAAMVHHPADVVCMSITGEDVQVSERHCSKRTGRMPAR
jgi:hypothetical protein